jgi:hypothetical protein
MFKNSNNLTSIPFKITQDKSKASNIRMEYMFAYCSKLKALPEIGYYCPNATQALFSNCNNIREIPQSWVDNIDTSYLTSLTNAYSGYQDYIFQGCYSLRKAPMELLRGNPNIAASSSYFYNGFQYCYTLDELVGVPIPSKSNFTSNAFTTTFQYCNRLKNLTFETNEDGTAKTAKWKSQTIDLSNYIGWTGTEYNLLNYNSGITKADKINSTTHSYAPDAVAAMNSNPNWYTDMYEYSRYGKNSAIATINSLPDTSAYLASSGGTNTIKFKANAGMGYSLDGVNQKIGDLSAEQIAVATAKGWTVSLV